jgi:hypothetical protein
VFVFTGYNIFTDFDTIEIKNFIQLWTGCCLHWLGHMYELKAYPTIRYDKSLFQQYVCVVGGIGRRGYCLQSTMCPDRDRYLDIGPTKPSLYH